MDREATAKLLEGPGQSEVYWPAPGARLRNDPASERALAAAALTHQEAAEVALGLSRAARRVRDAWQAAVQSLLEHASVRRYNEAVEAYREAERKGARR